MAALSQRELPLLLQPLFLQGFQLPKHPLPLEPLTKQEATFSSLPTSPYCIVFIINGKDCSKLEISWCRPFEKSWSVKVVDFGAWLTSEWSCGLYCSCRRFGEEFKCMHCDEVVIWQPSGWMSYDIERKGFRGGGILMDDGKSWWSELDEMDLDDLLCGLVKKDSVISFSSFNSIGVDSYDLSPAEFRIKSSRENPQGTGSVKAAWMEPTFPWK
ncbi:hypothetical protein HPP92_026605 [Vanilla planifolia]|uniref:Uncharacterized protein n=1 Tax=Vanilla planifolia TaxID=51239 RepID=A0A835U7G0_VANPL|nr:hypothetical protein HPP92_026823 [Vanilla planifolia]KAG0450730.1 hypothetical protein HPP92_026605 [Vanilla planifolia]